MTSQMREATASTRETRAMGPWRLGCTLLKLASPRCLGLLEDRLYHKLSSALALLTGCTLDRPPLGFPPPAPQLVVLPLSPLWTSLCSTLKSRRPRPLPQNTENPSSGCRLHSLSSFLFCLLFFFLIYLFLVMLGLHGSTRAFSSCGEEGLLCS